jgi:molybdopterin-guanine dinucleotide biosynthesis protein A
MIAGARSALGDFAPVVEDRDPGLGPLSGICAALERTQAGHAVFISVDMPLLPSSLLQYLLHHARITGRAVTLASVTGFAQTFPAVLDHAVLPVLRSELAGRRLGCFRSFKAVAAKLEQPVSIVSVELVAQAGQAEHPHGINAGRWLLNVNAPGDLGRAAGQSASDIA